MSDIVEQAIQAATDSPAYRAARNCDAVRKFIQHKQIDSGWDETVNHAPLLSVSQHTLPDGQAIYHAVFLFQNVVFLTMLLAPTEGGYVKLSPDGTWGGVEIVG